MDQAGTSRIEHTLVDNDRAGHGIIRKHGEQEVRLAQLSRCRGSLGTLGDQFLHGIRRAIPHAHLMSTAEQQTGNGFAPLHRLPALALTAFSQREDRIRALTSGFQMHVTKPVAPEELIVVIATMALRG